MERFAVPMQRELIVHRYEDTLQIKEYHFTDSHLT
jgi:hypothetical protein